MGVVSISFVVDRGEFRFSQRCGNEDGNGCGVVDESLGSWVSRVLITIIVDSFGRPQGS